MLKAQWSLSRFAGTCALLRCDFVRAPQFEYTQIPDSGHDLSSGLITLSTLRLLPNGARETTACLLSRIAEVRLPEVRCDIRPP